MDALLVAGEVDMAIGGDQGGSIRIPGCWCGVYGLKGTHGLVPYTGGFPIELTLDHLGPMANSTEDVALLLEAIAGKDGLDPRQYEVKTDQYTKAIGQGIKGLKIGVVKEGFGLEELSEPDVDESGRVIGVPSSKFLLQLGKKIYKDHEYRVVVEYENPLDVPAPGMGMGAIGGIVAIMGDGEWPAYDPNDPDYVLDLNNTITAPDRMGGHGHGGGHGPKPMEEMDMPAGDGEGEGSEGEAAGVETEGHHPEPEKEGHDHGGSQDGGNDGQSNG